MLEKFRQDTCHNTHVSLIDPKGKFMINKVEQEGFWTHYLKEVDKESCLGIAEKPQAELPVIVDVDLKIEDCEGDVQGLYTEDQVKDLIMVYQTVLREIVEECDDMTLTCLFLSKKPYRKTQGEKELVKHGFHLHFPFCFMSRDNQIAHLIPRVKDRLNEIKLFDPLVENSGDVIDDCTSKPWLLYGSKKEIGLEPYLIDKVYDSALEEVSLEKALSAYEIYDAKDKLIKVKGRVKEYLPRILSIFVSNRNVKEVKKHVISPLKAKLKAERKQLDEFVKESVTKQLSVAELLLPMLNPSRAVCRDEWIYIGWLLFNISEGCDKGFELWNQFSSSAENYDEDGCIACWSKMVKKDTPTLATLKFYAKMDNPIEYGKFKKSIIAQHVEQSVQGSSHLDIAKILQTEFADEFVCANVESKSWYQFVSNKWKEINAGTGLYNKIFSTVLPCYEDAKQTLRMRQRRSGEDDDDGGKCVGYDEAMITNQLKQIDKVIAKLKDSPWTRNVMNIALHLFYDEKFLTKLDMNKYLIAFKNGVYDLKHNVFRSGRPEDYLSKHIPHNYRECSEMDADVQEVRDIFQKILIDKEVHKYFLDMASDVFVGGNTQKVVLFCIGDGDNGKSIALMFFYCMLGRLAVKLNSTIITGKKPTTGAANADMARTGGGVRLCTIEEPNQDEEINIGVLKHLSGNDSFYARDLFERGKDGKEIEPMFKIYFICNKLPALRYADKATFNRVRVIPFESTFCDPAKGNIAPEDPIEQIRQKRFPVDKTIQERIPSLVEAFIWILLDHRKRITSRYEPKKVMEATEFYKTKNDFYISFSKECIVEEKEAYISLTELYSRFKEWFKESIPNKSLPLKTDIEEYFIKLWGDYDKQPKKWKGYRPRNVTDDQQSEEPVQEVF